MGRVEAQATDMGRVEAQAVVPVMDPVMDPVMVPVMVPVMDPVMVPVMVPAIQLLIPDQSQATLRQQRKPSRAVQCMEAAMPSWFEKFSGGVLIILSTSMLLVLSDDSSKSLCSSDITIACYFKYKLNTALHFLTLVT
jgi:hypothetical protein